jgi:DDE superfamily endonuclease
VVDGLADGLATRVQRPSGWANQKVWYDAKRHVHTAQGLAVSTVWGDLLWCDGGWPGSCHEHELLTLSWLDPVPDASGVATILDRGFRGMVKTREHWHAPVGDRRTKTGSPTRNGRSTVARRGRALVEQAIGHLADAWSLRRWRGRFCRVRSVFRAAGALVCLGRWLHRVPT